MAETVTVTQLNNRIKTLMKHASVNDIWVSGEISGLKRYQSGHYYFSLKDDKSVVSAVLFANSRLSMSFEPKDGDKVDAFGSADLYPPSGRYQFVVSTMRRSGVGDLYARFEALKAKLKEEGLFDESRKRPLPPYPRRIGVVTSQSGAVIHDIITTSAPRFPADIYLAPAQVQGEGAAKTIVKGIELLDRFGVDVIIVGRGGGSIEDLWPFNEEIVARAIVASKTPVVSAVGHETDFTIADFVADVRAPTPTGAAAIVLRNRSDVASDLDSLLGRAAGALDSRWRTAKGRFDVASAKLAPDKAEGDLGMREMRLEMLSSGADDAVWRLFDDSSKRLDSMVEKTSPKHVAETMEAKSSRVDDLGRRAALALSACSDRASSRLRLATSRCGPERLTPTLEYGRKAIDSALVRADQALGSLMSVGERRIQSIGDRPDAAFSAAMRTRNAELEGVSRSLEAVSPLGVLSRGYGLIAREDGTLVTSAGSMAEGDRVLVRMHDGTVGARITDKEEKR